jgi:hypothetical protein
MALSTRIAQVCNKRSRNVVQGIFTHMEQQAARVANSNGAHQPATAACGDAEATRRVVHSVFGKMRASSTPLAVEDTFRHINNSATIGLATDTTTRTEKQRNSVSAIFNLMDERDAAAATATAPPRPKQVSQYCTMTLWELLAADYPMSAFQLVERGARARATSKATADQRAAVDSIFNLMHDGDLQNTTVTHHRVEEQRDSVDAIFNLMNAREAQAAERDAMDAIFNSMNARDAQAAERDSVDAIFNSMNAADAQAAEATPHRLTIDSVFREMEVCDAHVLELAAKEAELSRMDEHRQRVAGVSVHKVQQSVA